MNGVRLRWGTVHELLAFNAWCRKRTLRIHEMKALVTAPRDAATLVSKDYEETKDSQKAMEEFVETLWPEIAALKSAQLEHQKGVLDHYKDQPFVLIKKQGPDGSMGVDLMPRE